MKKFSSTILLLVFFCSYVYGQSHDVIVYGATGAGFTAAIAACQEGMDVALVEPFNHIGGMVSGGLSHTDYGDVTVLGGLTLEFHERVAKHYGKPVFYWRGPEPHVAEKIMKDWLSECGVKVYYNKRISSVSKSGNTITSISFLDGSTMKGSVFIDAGYEGDLMAKAQVSYTWGREGVDEYDESWAGRKPITFTNHQIYDRLNPFIDYDEKKELLPLINKRPMVPIGEGDQGIQSYCFRMIGTDVKENMIPWPKPENYDPSTYELLRRYVIANPDEVKRTIGFWPTLPNRKSDMNSSNGLSTNLLDGSSWDYPEAGYELRDSIWQWHKDYTLGLAYFLSTHPDVPKDIRDYMKTFGLCKDEFLDTDNFPHQLYVREARRMKGVYHMTQHDLMTDTVKYDAIAMSNYNIDIREMQRSVVPLSRFPDLKYEVYNEGYQSIPVAQYQIPYRALVPKYDECQNLIVPVCLSGTHSAIGSIRMEPTYMVLGHSAGTAAAMAVKENRSVQLLDMVSLQKRLIEQRQVVSLKGNPYGLRNTENKIVIDNNMIEYTSHTGNWSEEETQHEIGRYEMNFRIKYDDAGALPFILTFSRKANTRCTCGVLGGRSLPIAPW